MFTDIWEVLRAFASNIRDSCQEFLTITLGRFKAFVADLTEAQVVIGLTAIGLVIATLSAKRFSKSDGRLARERKKSLETTVHAKANELLTVAYESILVLEQFREFAKIDLEQYTELYDLGYMEEPENTKDDVWLYTSFSEAVSRINIARLRSDEATAHKYLQEGFSAKSVDELENAVRNLNEKIEEARRDGEHARHFLHRIYENDNKDTQGKRAELIRTQKSKRKTSPK